MDNVLVLDFVMAWEERAVGSGPEELSLNGVYLEKEAGFDS